MTDHRLPRAAAKPVNFATAYIGQRESSPSAWSGPSWELLVRLSKLPESATAWQGHRAVVLVWRAAVGEVLGYGAEPDADGYRPGHDVWVDLPNGDRWRSETTVAGSVNDGLVVILAALSPSPCEELTAHASSLLLAEKATTPLKVGWREP